MSNTVFCDKSGRSPKIDMLIFSPAHNAERYFFTCFLEDYIILLREKANFIYKSVGETTLRADCLNLKL